MADPIARDARPRLLQGGGEDAEARAAQRSGASGLTWVLAGLLAFAIGAAAVQSARLDRMTEHADELTAHAEALRVELADAQVQIRTYQSQQELVRASVADLADRVAALYEIVKNSAVPVSDEAEATAR